MAKTAKRTSAERRNGKAGSPAGIERESPEPAPPVRTDDAALARQNGPQVVTLDMVKRDLLVQAFIKRADAQLGVLGYTEHGLRHTSLVGNIARNVLQRLGYPDRTCELA